MKKPVKNTSKPPRQREGQEFPGGKKMRKALKRLKARRDATPQVSSNKMQYHNPGSMK